jgi:hypothetical protein
MKHLSEIKEGILSNIGQHAVNHVKRRIKRAARDIFSPKLVKAVRTLKKLSQPVKEELKIGEKDEDGDVDFKKVGKSEKKKSKLKKKIRKYMGKKRDRTKTGSKAHEIEVSPEIPDAKT